MSSAALSGHNVTVGSPFGVSRSHALEVSHYMNRLQLLSLGPGPFGLLGVYNQNTTNNSASILQNKYVMKLNNVGAVNLVHDIKVGH